MMEEDEKEIDKKLFAAMHRVAHRDDFLHQKIVGVMGDYVASQTFISDSIYVSHQDRELLLPLFPTRRLDISYHGFGPRPRAFQPNVKVAPLQALPPKLPPPSLSSQLMTKNAPDAPKRKLSGTSVNTHEKKQTHQVCSSTGLNSRATPSSVTVTVQRPSGAHDTFPKSESQLAQKETKVKSDETIKSKQIEDLVPSLQNQVDRHQKIDIGDIIKEMTVPQLISPISSPETRMSVEMVLEEMITHICPLSPISNPERQDFTVLRKENRTFSPAGEACDRNPNISLHSVQDILGDISSSSDEEKDADESADPPVIESISPKSANLDTTENVFNLEENKLGTVYAPKSEEISCLGPEITESKESKNNPMTTGLCKGASKISRPIIDKNLFESSKTEQRTTDVPCSKIPIARTIQENSEKEFRVTHYPKECTDSVKRPVSSSDAFKFQRSQHKMKIAPPSASQIVSRPKNVMPVSMQGQDKQHILSNILQMKDNKTPHNSQPTKHGSPKTRSVIGLSYPKQQQQRVATNENGVSVRLCNLSKNVCVSKPSDSLSSDLQPLIPAEQKSSPSTRSPKDVCAPNKIDSLSKESQPPMAALTADRSLPMSKLSNDPYIANAFDSLSNESQPYTIPSHEKTLLKGPLYSSVKRYKSSNERDNRWTPQKESDKKMLLMKLVVSPYKLSPSNSPKAEPSFPKFKGKSLQVKINLKLMNENSRNHLYSQLAKRTIPLSRKPESSSSPLFFSDSSDNPRRKKKTVSKYKKVLIKLDTKLLSFVPAQNTFRHSFLDQRDAEPLTKRLCISSLLRDSRQTSQEMMEVERDIKKPLEENSKSCYSRAKYFKDQAKIMKKEAQMFLHLLATNWFVLCGHQMEKEGRSPNSVRRHLDEMGSFLNEIGCFKDVRMEALRYLLRAVVCQKLHELSSERRHQLQTDLNTEYKSIFGISFSASESTFRKSLDQHQKKPGNNPLAKSMSVSYRFLQLNKEYQSLIELLVKSQEFLSKAKKLMQEKCQFFNLVKSRLRNLNICLEIPLIVDFVKTCTELLQPKELAFIIAAQSR